jgi:hypothetical protein
VAVVTNSAGVKNRWRPLHSGQGLKARTVYYACPGGTAGRDLAAEQRRTGRSWSPKAPSHWKSETVAALGPAPTRPPPAARASDLSLETCLPVRAPQSEKHSMYGIVLIRPQSEKAVTRGYSQARNRPTQSRYAATRRGFGFQ